MVLSWLKKNPNLFQVTDFSPKLNYGFAVQRNICKKKWSTENDRQYIPILIIACHSRQLLFPIQYASCYLEHERWVAHSFCESIRSREIRLGAQNPQRLQIRETSQRLIDIASENKQVVSDTLLSSYFNYRVCNLKKIFFIIMYVFLMFFIKQSCMSKFVDKSWNWICTNI